MHGYAKDNYLLVLSQTSCHHDSAHITFLSPIQKITSTTSFIIEKQASQKNELLENNAYWGALIEKHNQCLYEMTKASSFSRPS